MCLASPAPDPSPRAVAEEEVELPTAHEFVEEQPANQLGTQDRLDLTPGERCQGLQRAYTGGVDDAAERWGVGVQVGDQGAHRLGVGDINARNLRRGRPVGGGVRAENN